MFPQTATHFLLPFSQLLTVQFTMLTNKTFAEFSDPFDYFFILILRLTIKKGIVSNVLPYENVSLDSKWLKLNHYKNV